MAIQTSIRKAYEHGLQQESAYSRAAIEWWQEDEELCMEKAEQAAAQACLAAERGELDEALRHAVRACRLEAQEYPECPAWRPLCRAIRDVIRRKARRDRETSHCKNFSWPSLTKREGVP